MHQMSHPCVTMITTAPGLWASCDGQWCGPGPGPAVTEISVVPSLCVTLTASMQSLREGQAGARAPEPASEPEPSLS